MSVGLAGLALGTLIWPLLSTFYIGALGWRLAFPALAVSWAVIVFPLTVAFFRGPSQAARAVEPSAGTRDVASGHLRLAELYRLVCQF